MSQTTCINHPSGSHFVVIYDWQVALCEGNTTTAALLSFFERWHNVKLAMRPKNIQSNNVAAAHGDERSQDESTLQFHSEQELIDGIQSIGKRDSVRKSINWLESEGFISIHGNPNKRYAFDKTRYFQFYPDVVNELLKTGIPENRHTMSKNQPRSLKNQSRSSENTSAITDHASKNPSDQEDPPTPQGGKEGERNFGFEIRQEVTAQPPATLLSQSEVTQLTSKTVMKADLAPTRVDPFFNKRRAPKDIEWDWLPDGPWRTAEGKLDNEFSTAIAKRWIKEHGGDVHEKKVNVLKHFRNDPTNLPIEWEWYQSTTIHRAANIQTRKINGLDTAKDEQEILKHSAALKELPEKMRVTESKSPGKLVEEVAGYATKYVEQVECTQQTPILESVATVTDDIWDKVKAESDQYEATAKTAPEGAENAEMYKHSIDLEKRAYFEKLHQRKSQSLVTQVPRELPDGPELIAQQIKNLASGKSMPKVSDQDKKEKTRLSHWNNLLSTGLPTVMADAERQARKAGYIVVDGQVVEPEF